MAFLMSEWRSVENSCFPRCCLPVTSQISVSASLKLYIQRQASSLPRYALEQMLYLLVGWIPTIVGIGLRGFLYRLIFKMDGLAAIENGVRFRFADHIHLHQGCYLDHGCYLHAYPKGN